MSNISRYISPCYIEDMTVMTSFKQHTIQINGSMREYITVNIENTNKNVLLCFPGGSETPQQFLNYTQFHLINDPIIVFLGQPSANGFTFQNAFPWLLKESYQNDVDFVDAVVNKHFYNNTPSNIFLTGKSDGAGFTILYSNLSIYKSYIKAIGICSDAHFGINSIENIGSYTMFNRFWGKNGTIIPYNIILPKKNISIFIIHGTGDTVIPYYGGKYNNVNAKKRSDRTLWTTIDPTMNNTYTPNIPTYLYKIQQMNYCSKSSIINDSNYSFHTYTNGTTVVNLITINKQNHCWSGHENSGHDSNSPANFHLDATYLFILFFNLNPGRYTPTVDTIPKNLRNYENITNILTHH